ncbi:hypothetical protein [Falsibacillus pallidus]|uniref:hypothetical protein n=1 Tax=Falsibacillus pallidus TaxID=493781 RepID=UPI003D97E18E
MIMDNMNSPFGKMNHNPFRNWNDHPSPFNNSKLVHEENNDESEDDDSAAIKRSYAIGTIGEKIISIPLIYPPPKIESTQIESLEKMTNPLIHNHDSESGKTSNSDPLHELEGEQRRIGQLEREEMVAFMEEEFTSLLEDETADINEIDDFHSEPSSYENEASSLQDEILNLLVEDRDPYPDYLHDEESSGTLEGKFFSILEGDVEQDSTVVENNPYVQSFEDDSSLMLGGSLLLEEQGSNMSGEGLESNEGKEDSSADEEEENTDYELDPFLDAGEEEVNVEGEEVVSESKETSSLEDEFFSILEDKDSFSISEEKESFKEKDAAENNDEYSLRLAKYLWGNDWNSNDNGEYEEEDFLSTLEDDDYIEEEIGSNEDIIYSLLDSSDSEESVNESSFLDGDQEKSISPVEKKREYSILEDQFEIEMLEEDEAAEIPSEYTHDCKQKEEACPIVKIPILLGEIALEINLFETADISIMMDRISKVDWSLQSFESQVALPSNTAFFKGLLIADIEYESNGIAYSLKFPVSWSKTAEINWIYPPDIPHASQQEFMFQSAGNEINFHHESTQQFAEKIDAQIKSFHFNCNEDFHSSEGKTQLDIKGCAILAIDLVQEQFINFNFYPY